MATRYAVPSAAGWDWGSTTNWSATDGGAGGATVPVDTDTVVLKCAFLPAVGLDQSTIQLAALHILEGLGGDSSGLSLGTAAAALQIDATDVYIANSRLAFIKLSGAYTNVYCRKLGGTLYLGVGSLAGAVTNFYGGESGVVEIADDMECTYFNSGNMTATIWADTTSAGDLELDISAGSKVDCYRKISSGTVDGYLKMLGAASLTISAGTAKLKIGSKGTVDVRSSGALGTIVGFNGGTLRADQTPGFLTAPTLSVLNKNPGFKKIVPSGSLIITSEPEYGWGSAGFGGNF